MVSHAGTVLLAELADRIGLTAALGEVTMLCGSAVPVMIRSGSGAGRCGGAIADGAVMISDVQTLADQQGLRGPAGSVASTPTIWRVLEGVANAPGMLGSIRLARAHARDRAWLARGELTGCELPGSRAAGRLLAQVVIDLDATLVTAVKKKTAPQSLVRGPVRSHAGGRSDGSR